MLSRLWKASIVLAVCLPAVCLVTHVPAAMAAGLPLDTPTFVAGASGMGKQSLTLSAGSSGAPAGFTVWWMTYEDYAAAGGTWPAPGHPGLHTASFWGKPTLNVFFGDSPSFVLAAHRKITVEIGDLADESGITSSSRGELVPGTHYVFCAFANGSAERPESVHSSTIEALTLGQFDCTFTQGYWKNHPEDWPVLTLTLGTVSYDQDQLLDIFDEPTAGNGLISLAHQLIATKLNIANGADPTDIQDVVDDADDLIGGLVVPPVGSGFLAPSATSDLTEALDDFNNGITGPGHCGPGACCLPDGSCEVMEPFDCLDAGGVFHGTGVECDPALCVETGACCFPTTGTCEPLTEAECTEQGGIYGGPGVDCDTTPCTVVVGACCFHPGGDCQILSAAACEAAGGTYLGDGMGCNPGICPPTAVEKTTWGRLKTSERR